MKKVLLVVGVVLLLLGGGFGYFYYKNSRDHYDPSKYSATMTAKQFTVGATMAFSLPDQFDTTHTLSDKTTRVIFAYSKNRARELITYLDSQPVDYLAQRHTLFVTDIHKMPIFIRNTFALPKLKKSLFPILLLYDSALSKKFKGELDGEAFVLVKLHNKTITGVTEFKTLEALKGEL